LGGGRGLGSRENATVFPDREAANAEAKIWQALSTQAFTVVVEPAPAITHRDSTAFVPYTSFTT
jgi:hypothetical protein